MRQMVSTTVHAPDLELDRVADVLLTAKIAHAAMVRLAKEGHPDFSRKETDTTQGTLDKAANVERVTGSRLRAAKKQRQGKRATELTAQLLEARRRHFSAAVLHSAAVGRFNDTWADGWEPSRQRTSEECGPVAFLARLLMGEFKYKTKTVCLLLMKSGFIKTDAIEDALDRLTKIMRPRRRSNPR